MLSDQDTETKETPDSSEAPEEKEVDHLSDLSELEKIKLELQKEKEKAAQELAEGDDEETVIAMKGTVMMSGDFDQIDILSSVDVNKVRGKVKAIMPYGAFVEILPGKDGLLHVSEIKWEKVEDVSKVLEEGEEVKVKVLEVDRQGKIRLTMKGLED